MCVSADERVKMRWNVYTMEYYLAVKKETSPFATIWVDPEGTMLS